MNTDERQAVERCRAGDPAGLEFLVQTHQLRALRVAYLITGDRMTAEDAVQEAFLSVFERIGQLRDEEAFGSWLLRIVRNCALVMVRKADRSDPLEAGGHGTAGPQVQARLERAETVQEVREALWRLSPEQRASLVLRYYGDMSVEEIAGMTDVPPGTVKWRLYEGRRRLRQALRWPERLSSER